jgi:hypothetical protein
MRCGLPFGFDDALDLLEVGEDSDVVAILASTR